MALFQQGKLVILKKDGSDGVAFNAEKSHVINVGTNITCEIRPQNIPNLLGFHFKIVPEKLGRVSEFSQF